MSLQKATDNTAISSLVMQMRADDSVTHRGVITPNCCAVGVCALGLWGREVWECVSDE